MFSSELSWARHPFPSRAAGIILGSLLMFAVGASLFGPRSLAFSFPISVGGFLIAAGMRGDLHLADVRFGPVGLSLAGFLGFALLSAVWARNPSVPLEKASVAMLVAAGSIIVSSLVGQETRANLLHMGEGVFIGLLAGLLYLLIELATHQSIEIALFNALALKPQDLKPEGFFTWSGERLIGIVKDQLSRNIAPAAVLLWPTALIVSGSWRTPWRTLGVIGLVLLTGLVVMMSAHESSKLALVAGVIAFATAMVSLRWAQRLILAAWITACLAVVPLVILAHHLDLHNAAWLQASARHRIIIWNETAERALASPWIGVGANMTYVLGPELERENPEIRREALARTLNIHSHNVYLQTWFELGAVGAVLLTLFGLSLLGAIRTMVPPLQPYAYATFASAAAMASTSYGMWQLWYMALFGLSVVVFSIGARLSSPPTGRVAVSI